VKKLAPVVIVVALVATWQAYQGHRRASVDSGPPGSFAPHSPAPSTSPSPRARSSAPSSSSELRAGQQVELEGTVVKVLSDDTTGSRHQRFIVRLPSGQTVLIAHNIDIAPRVDGIASGDSVRFSGAFEENDKGGVVHWTHHDPSGRHPDGFIVHQGHTYR
jgi:hypothetical protein